MEHHHPVLYYYNLGKDKKNLYDPIYKMVHKQRFFIGGSTWSFSVEKQVKDPYNKMIGSWEP